MRRDAVRPEAQRQRFALRGFAEARVRVTTVNGSAAINEFVRAIFKDSGFAATFPPAAVDASADGNMGATVAIADITATGPGGEPATEQVRDFHVWRRNYGDGGCRR